MLKIVSLTAGTSISRCSQGISCWCLLRCCPSPSGPEEIADRGRCGQGNRYHQALTGVGIHLTFAIPLPAAYLLGGRTQATPACVTEEHIDELPVIVKVKLLKERETASKRDSGKAWYKKNYFPPVFQFHTPIPMKSYLCIFFFKGRIWWESKVV